MGRGRKRYRWEIASYQNRKVCEPYPIDDADTLHVESPEDHCLQKRLCRWESINDDIRMETHEEPRAPEYGLTVGLNDEETHDTGEVYEAGLQISASALTPTILGDASVELHGKASHQQLNSFSNSSPLGTVSPLRSSSMNIKTFSSGLPVSTSHSSDFDEKDTEYRRLSTFLYTAEIAGVSQRTIEKLLHVEPIQSRYSYRSFISYAVKKSQVQKSHIPMCKFGHAALAGKLRTAENCPTCDGLLSRSKYKFWFMKPSSALKGMCGARETFSAIMEGCTRAKNGILQETSIAQAHDYYHGNMFTRIHAERLASWTKDSSELFVFLSLSTDGFECAKNRNGEAISSWPIVLSVLNNTPKHRSQASNALLLAFVPDSHDTSYFDSFVHEIIQDLKLLENGVSVACHDGKVRLLKAFLVFFTADWPAASKVLEYIGHTGKVFCRFCLKRRVYVRECQCLCTLPVSTKLLNSSVRRECDQGDVIKLECANERSASSIMKTWKMLRSKNVDEKTRKHVVDSSGIKRSSCLSPLHLDFKYSFPYDVMHLVLLGWTKHFLRLVTATHSRHLHMSKLPHYCIPAPVLEKINSAMNRSSTGIPRCWGRAPLALENIARYKAEDLKRHAQLYLLPYFHKYKVRKEIIHILHQTSHMITLAFGYDCSERSVRDLIMVVEQLYARFVRVFVGDLSSRFCLTPTTHAILHLPELLRECGPLPITSQFMVERLLGEIGKRVQQTSNLSAHLFHKNFKLLTLRLANDGAPINSSSDSVPLPISIEQFPIDTHPTVSSSEFHTGAHCHGRSTLNPRLTVAHLQAVKKFINRSFPTYAHCFRVHSVKEFHTVKLLKGSGSFVIESLGSFRVRSQACGRNARQKFCIAAHFLMESSQSSLFSSRVSDALRVQHLYYGSVKRILEFKLDLGGKQVEAVFLEVKWHYNLIEDDCFDLVYSENLKTGETTIEHVQCVERLIGFLDLDGRRYYVDPLRFHNESTTRAVLQGTGKRV